MIFFDMKRKLLVSAFFVTVFGLPVCWYLFLQFFGTNQFDLPKLGSWQCNAVQLSGASVVVDRQQSIDYPNEMSRISEHLQNQQGITLVLFEQEACELPNAVYLVDASLEVRGTFGINRAEVDRLLAEIDIYLHNTNP